MGGWVDNHEATMILRLAKEACQTLKLDMDMQEAFVPGVRRGYLVVPYRPRSSENEQAIKPD